MKERIQNLPIRDVRLRLEKLGPRPHLVVAESAERPLRAWGIGFLGATPDDQQRWLARFRELLDGLTGPLQVVWRSAPRRPAEVHVMGTTAQALASMGLRSAPAPAPSGRATFGEEEATHWRDSHGWHRTWWVERFPGGMLEAGWLLRLAPPGVDLSISWHADVFPTASAVGYLQRQMAQMRAQQAGGVTDPSLTSAVPAALDLQRRLAGNQERAFHVGLYLTVSARSRRSLEAGAAALGEAARAALCTILPATFRQFDGRLATLPAGIDRLGRSRVLDTSSLVTLFPWLHAHVHDQGGFLLGENIAAGTSVVLNPWDQARYENGNIAIFGHSGAGKTYLMSSIAVGALEKGAQVFILDPEHEYGALANRLGGVDVQLGLGSEHSLNVLDSAQGMADAVDLISIICGGLDEVEKAAVDQAVRLAFKERVTPLLGEVATRLPPTSRAAKVLLRWVSGNLGRIFNAPTNIDLEAPIVVFGMRELREEMIAPVHFLLAEALWGRIKTDRRRRLLIIDELGLLFDDPTLRRFVVRLARRIRKYEGALAFATQNPGDLLSSDHGLVVATNPAIRFFGAQRPSEAQRLQRTFQFSDVQRQSIESGRRGEFLLSAGHDRLALRVEPSAGVQALLLSGTSMG